MKSHIPSARPLWSLLEDAVVESDPERGHLTVHGRWGDILLHDESPVVLEALHRMTLGPVSLENIPALHENFVSWKSGTGRPCQMWRRLKQTLDQLGGCVIPSLGLDDGVGPILSVVAIAGDAVFTLPHIPHSQPISILADTSIEGLNGDQAMVCPGLDYQVTLHRAPATEIAKSLMHSPSSTIAEIANNLQVERLIVADVVAYIAGAGFIVLPPGEIGSAACADG
ncbi:hypothetical protein [Nocardia sp. NRRL S-836]|uniref:hypothetical protein n=1 Tax=Nocardia sp. NRRL S-836 TaxID=1519492 RepID=UPI0006AE6017|nr:hypothetical protein [Nocardia sp. NRRL S-836]KOV80022.1 hypothetical protein ADL03_33945 [Nocardia sp. NRRL S-836]